ncbi:nucleoside triphosphate pyrophosphohydrolase family protein [Marinisporobacter balticus]|uniref:MazG-like nucleotide pyrophosphohydrolase family protein n=1 Tax=Marinisporobacter balticus TaxID=2018667 RepID=A0A4V2SCF4_9FIRM|nr:hypothetical protein [Marinisporobacter balticus]TCO79110.1 hypothetical protein EV214_103162 [Marinisporobacter balticus]
MNILIPILKKDETWKQHKKKLVEEYAELHNELTRTQFLEKDGAVVDEEQIGKVVEEAMDVIQVAVGIIYKALETHREIAIKKIQGHFVKLFDRGWKFIKILRMEED